MWSGKNWAAFAVVLAMPYVSHAFKDPGHMESGYGAAQARCLQMAAGWMPLTHYAFDQKMGACIRDYMRNVSYGGDPGAIADGIVAFDGAAGQSDVAATPATATRLSDL